MIPRRPVTEALEQLIATATGKPCGVGTVPLVDGLPVEPPYCLLYSLDSTTGGAPLADLNEDASFTYQVTCVSGPDPDQQDSQGTVTQAEWLADKVRTGILGRDPTTREWLHPLTVPGATVYCRQLDTEPGATSDPADAIITYVLRFRFDLTTAS